MAPNCLQLLAHPGSLVHSSLAVQGGSRQCKLKWSLAQTTASNSLSEYFSSGMCTTAAEGYLWHPFSFYWLPSGSEAQRKFPVKQMQKTESLWGLCYISLWVMFALMLCPLSKDGEINILLAQGFLLPALSRY